MRGHTPRAYTGLDVSAGTTVSGDDEKYRQIRGGIHAARIRNHS
jgi:hypothetical protein